MMWKKELAFKPVVWSIFQKFTGLKLICNH